MKVNAKIKKSSTSKHPTANRLKKLSKRSKKFQGKDSEGQLALQKRSQKDEGPKSQRAEVSSESTKTKKRKHGISSSPETLKKKKVKPPTSVEPTQDSPSVVNSKKSGKEQSSHHRKKKRKVYNKEAIENMKAKQLAKNEKTQKSTLGSPEAKKRRPKLPVRLETVDLKFSEDDTMTEFEGLWVAKEEVGRLAAARDEMKERNIAPEKLERRMKLLVRKAHRKLKLRLIAGLAKAERQAREREMFLSRQSQPRQRRRLPGRPSGLQLQEGDQLARFDGFWVAAEAVPRLQALRDKLKAEGKTEEQVGKLMKKERRNEERKVKSLGKLACAKCGGRGHLGSDCSAAARVSAGGTICFRCGDAGHRLADCPLPAGGSAGLPFATCFLCQKKGHMSRDCPQRRDDERETAAPAAKGMSVGSLSWRGLTHDESGEVGASIAKDVSAAAKAKGASVAAKAQKTSFSKTTAASSKHKRFDF